MLFIFIFTSTYNHNYKPFLNDLLTSYKNASSINMKLPNKRHIVYFVKPNNVNICADMFKAVQRY